MQTSKAVAQFADDEVSPPNGGLAAACKGLRDDQGIDARSLMASARGLARRGRRRCGEASITPQGRGLCADAR